MKVFLKNLLSYNYRNQFNFLFWATPVACVILNSPIGN